MTDQTSIRAASSRLPPQDAHSSTVTDGRQTARPRAPQQPAAIPSPGSRRRPASRPGQMAVTSQSASDIVIRAALPQAPACELIRSAASGCQGPGDQATRRERCGRTLRERCGL